MNLSLRWSGEFIVRDLTHITISPRRLFCRVDPWGRFPMRIFALIAAFAFVSATAQAGEARSLSLNGVDQKLPGALGKAAETPRVVEAPKPPDPPKPPEPPKAVEAAPAAAPAQAVEAPKEAPAFVQRPSVVGTKPAENKEGQVTFDETKPAAPAATTTTEKPKQAKADKPKRKRAHWDEARIMREIYRYSGYAGMIGGW
jgi:outer membrane biosynthesis protein TonB